MTISNIGGVAIITGAASGIGRGTAVAFAKAGCRQILIGDINYDGLETTRQTLHSIRSDIEVEVKEVDISEEQSVQHFVDLGVTKFGRIDYACNVAGIVPPRTPIEKIDVETFDRVVNVNAYGTFLCHRAEIRQMLKQEPSEGIRGSIVSVSSLAGLNASPGVTPYSSTKFAIIGMVKTDAMDYGPQGIRINAVCPGFTNTEALHQMSTESQRNALAEGIPLRRLGRPEEIGDAIVFLSSDNATYINGTALVVDGGALLHRKG